MEQSLHEGVTILSFKGPTLVLLNRTDSRFIRRLNHEIGERDSLNASGLLNTFFLIRKKTGFRSLRA